MAATRRRARVAVACPVAILLPRLSKRPEALIDLRFPLCDLAFRHIFLRFPLLDQSVSDIRLRPSLFDQTFSQTVLAFFLSFVTLGHIEHTARQK
jgi:hypothetical protein